MKIYLLIIVARCISIKANSQFSNCQDLLPYGIFIRIKNIIPMQQQNALAKHFKNGLQWLKNNKEAAQAQCAIIYAWNEFDEGGWLCPTFNNNTERINSIHSVLKQQ